ncbi:hypothetical protein Tco_1133415 [Tanacetum coccineum]
MVMVHPSPLPIPPTPPWMLDMLPLNLHMPTPNAALISTVQSYNPSHSTSNRPNCTTHAQQQSHPLPCCPPPGSRPINPGQLQPNLVSPPAAPYPGAPAAPYPGGQAQPTYSTASTYTNAPNIYPTTPPGLPTSSPYPSYPPNSNPMASLVPSYPPNPACPPTGFPGSNTQTYPPTSGNSTYPPNPSPYPNYPPGGAAHPPQTSYPPQTATYPPQGNTYPPQGNTYPPQGNAYPPQGNTYPPQTGYQAPQGYPPQQGSGGGYPPNPNSGVYPPPPY